MIENKSATRRSVLAASASGALAASLAGCFGGDDDEDESAGNIDPEDIERGGEFSIGVPNGIDAPNPLTASTAHSIDLLELIYQTGVVVDPESFEIRPWAFTDWDAEASEDGMTIYVSINEDLEWTDGEPFTAEDVIFTYEYCRDQQPERFRSTVEPLDSVSEADNEFDVRLSLSEFIGTWETDLLSLYMLPEHIWSEIDNHAEYDGNDSVGLGPGEITSYDPAAVEISFDRETPLTQYEWIGDHDELITSGPFLDGIRFEVFEGQSALQRAFLDGEIDAVYDGSFDPNQAEAIEGHDDLRLVSGHDDGYQGFTLNTRNAPFDDQAFRQALRMGVNDSQWVEGINRGYAVRGSLVIVPAYERLRPESAAEGAEIQQSSDEEAAPATQALWHRETENGDLDVEAIREFLESGEVIDGSKGSYAGFDYPGSLTSFGGTDQSDASYDYEFDTVQSDILEETDADAELYADGQTIEELNDGPVAVLNYPAESYPLVTEFTRSYIDDLHRLGIPVEEEVVTASVMADRVYLDADFGIYPMNWSNTSSRGVSTLYNLFHSDNANGDGGGAFASNASGYGLDGSGLDEEIDAMRAEPDEESRNELVREAAERLYLEAPTLVAGYGPAEWPARDDEYNGFVADIAGVGSSSLWVQCLNIHQE